ncbi:MAG: TerC family protein [Flavobacteriales bacterium]
MDFLHSILGPDLEAAGLIILNLILIESLLSVDNAAVLATMVMDLPEEQRGKALKWGIIGAYVFRGLSLLFASWLIHIWWLKPMGGLYLLYLSFEYFYTKNTPQKEDDVLNKEGNFFYRYTFGMLGTFWATVAMVEIMDLAFSIDNVFAAVAYVENFPQPQGFYLVCIGVFIGILAMRFVAQGFVKLMKNYPFLETAAFIVIGILGLKLTVSFITHFYPESAFTHFLDSEQTDLYLSILTVGVFVVPILSSALFGFPGKNKESNS